MAKLRFLYTNLFSASTTALTAASAASGLPAAAAQNPDRSAIYRSLTQAGAQTLDIDLGSVLPVACAAVANAKVVGTGVIEVYERGDAGSPGAANLVATLPAQNALTKAAAVFFAQASHRHWQFKWTNPTSASDYAELGFAFLGVPYEVPVNPSAPSETPRADPSISKESVGGQKTFSRRQKFYAGQWQFEGVGQTMHDTLQALWDQVGSTQSIFHVLDDTIGWTCWYARLTGQMGSQFTNVPNQYTVTFPWEEVR